MSRIVIAMLIYHRHKPTTLTCWARREDVMCFLWSTNIIQRVF
jgi:hypothetical protein